MRDNFYSPSSVTVTVGTTVTWTWTGFGSHSVTFEDGLGSSGVQNTGQIDRTFNTVGTFRFRCTVHSGNFTSGMIGSVKVE